MRRPAHRHYEYDSWEAIREIAEILERIHSIENSSGGMEAFGLAKSLSGVDS